MTQAQDLKSLFENAKHREIVAVYKAAARSFNNTELEIVAAAYDRLGLGDEEYEVLSGIVNRFPLFLTYSIPSDYHYYGNFMKAGLMDRFRTVVTTAYLESIKDTALGLVILNAFYQDQAVRQKHEDNKYAKKNGLKPKWDSGSLIREWVVLIQLM